MLLQVPKPAGGMDTRAPAVRNADTKRVNAMSIIIEIALALILVGGAWSSHLTRGRRSVHRGDMISRRVDAYIETIRRERKSPELVAMSDNELRDVLLSSAHNLRCTATGGCTASGVRRGRAAHRRHSRGHREGTRGFGWRSWWRRWRLTASTQFLGGH